MPVCAPAAEHAHAVCSCQPGHPPADVAQADKRHGPAMEIRHRARHVSIPALLLLIANYYLQVPSEHDHQSQGVLGDRCGIKPGKVGHLDSPARGNRAEVLWDTGRGQLNPAQLGCFRQAGDRRQAIADARVLNMLLEDSLIPRIDELNLRKLGRKARQSLVKFTRAWLH